QFDGGHQPARPAADHDDGAIEIFVHPLHLHDVRRNAIIAIGSIRGMARTAMTNPTVAVVAQGAMGAGVGGRLAERGLHVITSLAGRSEASAKRAKAAGMQPASDAECAQADYFLSILPPSDAFALAQKMAALIGPGNKKPIY